MYKSIVPKLVSFETDLKEIHGFVMCQNLNFFPKAKEKSKFHYIVQVKHNIEVPFDYDFRSEYFVKKGSTWYFDRKVFFWHPKFSYDSEKKIFCFNRAYLLLPFRLGGMFAAGEHIANVIELDLFLEGYSILRGIAMQKESRNICVSAPGYNGKTTFLKEMLKKDARYIAEDYLILDLNKSMVYPSAPLAKENFWRRRSINNDLKSLLKKNPVFNNPVVMDKLYLVQNSQNENYITHPKTFIDFVLMNSLYFLNNLFTRSLVFEQRDTSAIVDRIERMREIKLNYSFIDIKKFNFNFL